MRLRLAASEPSSEAGALSVRLDEPPEAAEDGLVLLYLHGFGSSQDGDKADLFRDRCVNRGIAFASFDFQGHGSSGGSMLDLTLSRNLADLEAVHTKLEELGHSRVVLFGSSLGGLTALWHAWRHPDRVAGALLLAPALGLERTIVDELGSETIDRWRREGKLEVTQDLGTWDLGWGFVEDLKRHDFRKLCAGYRTPTLIFQGKHDSSVPWRQVVEFTTRAAGEAIELHLFADGDHRLLDRLPRLWDLTEEFLIARGLIKG